MGRVRGYATAAERHAKTVRLKALTARLSRVQRQADGGAVSVVRGGKALLRKRNDLRAGGLSEDQWRREWESSRLFLTADGDKAKNWGNETIRSNPDEGWLEVKLPVLLAHLANQSHGRYRLSCPVSFSYRGDEVAAQAASGAIRYDITCDAGRERWYLDASARQARQGIPTGSLGHPHREVPRPPSTDGFQRGPVGHRDRPRLHLPLGGRALAQPVAGASPQGDRSSRGSAGDRATRARAPGQAPRDREPARPSGGGTASPDAAPDQAGDQARTQETSRPTRPTAAARHQDRKTSPDHGRQPGSPRPFGTAH
jgi:hypothetical protein